MQHPGKPAAPFFRGSARLLREQASRQRKRHYSESKRAAHGRLISHESFRGCGNCQTLYQSAMKSVAAAVLFGFVAATGADAKSHSTFRVHAEANENNGPTFSTTLPLFGRTVTIEKSPALSENDVVGVRTYRAADG